MSSRSRIKKFSLGGCCVKMKFFESHIKTKHVQFSTILEVFHKLALIKSSITFEGFHKYLNVIWTNTHCHSQIIFVCRKSHFLTSLVSFAMLQESEKANRSWWLTNYSLRGLFICIEYIGINAISNERCKARAYLVARILRILIWENSNTQPPSNIWNAGIIKIDKAKSGFHVG